MEKRFFPLSAVTKRINELLEPAISRQFWVKAEISSGRERGGAFYCDLVETGPGGKVIAKIACTAWQVELNRIRASFRSRGLDLILTDGTVVGVLCSLQYSPQYGLSLRVIDADPAFVLGEMELKKRDLIERLQKEGLFQANKGRPVPTLPLRIGLITSKGSAAYNDFIQTLSLSGFGFRVSLADAMMQGDQAEKSVLRALSALQKLPVELIVLVRGGGSKTDLSYLDNESIARSIASCATPVWTGIGHEIDTSVLDHVANRSFKTPTAVAEELVARFVQMRRQLDESANALKTVWGYRLKTDRGHLERSQTGIRHGSRKLMDLTAGRLRERAQRLRLLVQGRISGEQISAGGKKERLRAKAAALLSGCRQGAAAHRQVLEHASRHLLTNSSALLSSLSQRFDRERFLRRVRTERDLIGKSRVQLAGRFLAAMQVRTNKQGAFKARFREEKILQLLNAQRRSLQEKMATLKASDPQSALRRGFALVYDRDGELVRSIRQLREKDRITTYLADGTVVSEVTTREGER